jgi:hypothetical protein
MTNRHNTTFTPAPATVTLAPTAARAPARTPRPDAHAPAPPDDPRPLSPRTRAARALRWFEPGYGTPPALRPYLGRGRADPDWPAAHPRFADPRWPARYDPKKSDMSAAQIERAHALLPGVFTTDCPACGTTTALLIPLPMRDYVDRPPCCSFTSSRGPLVPRDPAAGCEYNVPAFLARAAEHHDQRALELMCNGFHCGVAPLSHDPQFDTTLFRRNHPSASTPGPAEAIAADFDIAIALGRAVVVATSDSPWDQAQFESFATARGLRGAMTEPLATVPKGESGFRVIQDGSFDGAIPASSINARQLGRPRITMCTAAHFLAMLTRLRAAAPPGARILGFKTDINAAYPTLRLSQDDPPVHFASYRTATGQFALVQYRALKFGNAPSCGFFSRVQLVFLGALRRETLRVAAEGPWSPATAAAIRRVEFCGVIDDVAYLVEDVAAEPIHQTVMALHDTFRFPLNTQKLLTEGRPGQTLTYSGISVNLAADRIFLDDKRRAKWAAKLRLALAADRISSERIQSVHGIMQRVALVFVLGKAWLFSIRRLLAVASQARPERWLKLDQEQRDDIQLFVDYLERPAAEIPPAPALTRPGPRRTARLVSDASFRALCGASLTDGTVEFWVHHLTGPELERVGPSADKLHITRLELIAAAHNLVAWPCPSAEHIEIVADNEAAVTMINHGAARRDAVCNRALQAIAKILSQRGTTVGAVHAPTMENYITDSGTRSDPAEFDAFLQRMFPGVPTRRIRLATSPLLPYL